MKTAIKVVSMLIRLCGVLALLLGLLFWTNNARQLVSVHMVLGIVIVLGLWTMAILAFRAGVQPGLVVLGIVWGLIVPVLGMTQSNLLVGSFHWIIQIVHLLVGMGAMGIAENLARRIKAAQPALA